MQCDTIFAMPSFPPLASMKFYCNAPSLLKRNDETTKALHVWNIRAEENMILELLAGEECPTELDDFYAENTQSIYQLIVIRFFKIVTFASNYEDSRVLRKLYLYLFASVKYINMTL